MSISYTSISNSELHRLRESANREAKTREELNKIKKNRALREQDIRSQNEAEISRLNSAISNLKKENDKIRGDAKAQIDKLNSDFAKRLNTERDRVNHRIDTLGERVDKINRDLSDRLDKIDDHIKDTEERAKVYAEELFTLSRAMGELKPYKFGYGKAYEALKLLEGSVRADIENGNFEAALAISQSEVVKTMDNVASLTLLNDEFYKRLNDAKVKESALLETFEEYSAENVISYTDLDGKVKKASFDIDRWSGGALSAAGEEFEKIKEKLESAEKDSFGMGELQALEDSLEKLERSLEEVESLARDEFFASCNVESVAISLNRIMSDEGYVLEKSGFYENDERESFNMTYTDDEGNSVAFVISAGEGTAAKIAMETYGADPEDDEIKEGTRCAVASALQENNIDIDNVLISDKCNSKDSRESFIAEVSKREQKN